MAPKTLDAWKGCESSDWLQFSNLGNLLVDGPGEIDGHGSSWWTTPNQYDTLSCKLLQMNKKNCKPPDALHFHGCDNLKLSGLTHLNSARAHIAISNCNNVLGANGQLEKVVNVHVRDCSFSGTANEARIKTWQGGSGYARNIMFEKITLDGAQNSIIIDQFLL
ncbi:putative polygalacturonase [Prunus yedoensis var. nudiflora]|uniref:Putative polygalacturonase n=1 Tax=Prunus yedoensis var. nudiflora TaxID=2094558 RepID=A0A314Y082_PRUYE|nr:putative polygalacturonase [Prunus yedoensis var. nudiflora]